MTRKIKKVAEGSKAYNRIRRLAKALKMQTAYVNTAQRILNEREVHHFWERTILEKKLSVIGSSVNVLNDDYEEIEREAIALKDEIAALKEENATMKKDLQSARDGEETYRMACKYIYSRWWTNVGMFFGFVK